MPGPTLASLILGAAKDIERVDGTLDAELLLSTLLGSGYSRLAPDRGAGLDALVAEIREEAAGHPVAAVLDGPGEVRPTGGHALRDPVRGQPGYGGPFADASRDEDAPGV